MGEHQSNEFFIQKNVSTFRKVQQRNIIVQSSQKIFSVLVFIALPAIVNLASPSQNSSFKLTYSSRLKLLLQKERALLIF